MQFTCTLYFVLGWNASCYNCIHTYTYIHTYIHTCTYMYIQISSGCVRLQCIHNHAICISEHKLELQALIVLIYPQSVLSHDWWNNVSMVTVYCFRNNSPVSVNTYHPRGSSVIFTCGVLTRYLSVTVDSYHC